MLIMKTNIKEELTHPSLVRPRRQRCESRSSRRRRAIRSLQLDDVADHSHRSRRHGGRPTRSRHCCSTVAHS